MIPVDQTIIEADRGDCIRAAFASLFELDILQVPHFLLFGDRWGSVFVRFLQNFGYDYFGVGKPGEDDFSAQETVNEGIMASVPSKTFKGKFHMVIINNDGLVLHDPNPNRMYQDVNVLKTGELEDWFRIEKLIKEKTQ